MVGHLNRYGSAAVLPRSDFDHAPFGRTRIPNGGTRLHFFEPEGLERSFTRHRLFTGARFFNEEDFGPCQSLHCRTFPMGRVRPLVPSILLCNEHEKAGSQQPNCSNPDQCISERRKPKAFHQFKIRTSQLVEALKPFGELAFPNAPLAADFESRQFLVLDHAVHCSLRHLQQLSGFLKRQQA